jgi:hypothetical protein
MHVVLREWERCVLVNTRDVLVAKKSLTTGIQSI